MSIDGVRLQRQPITLRPAEGNANYQSVSSGGNLTFYLGGHSFIPQTSYLNFNLRILHGGRDNYPGEDDQPDTILDYLDPGSFKLEDLKQTIPEDYLEAAGLLELNDTDTITRDRWKQLLTVNGETTARGGFFTKFATNAFQRVTLESPLVGLIDLEENLEYTGQFRAFEAYTDRLTNMTTFYFSSRARDMLMGYRDLEEKYYGFELEIRIPLALLIGSFNPMTTEWTINNQDAPQRRLDFFPGFMFPTLLFNLTVKAYNRFLNFHVKNELGMEFYLNRYLIKHPPFALRRNQLTLDNINTSIPEVANVFGEGDNINIQQRRWEFSGTFPFTPMDIGTNQFISNLGLDNVLKSYGILFTVRDQFELFTNPNVRTFQIQFGSDQTNRMPVYEPRNSIPEYWDEYLQVALDPLNNPHKRISDENFNWFFSGLSKVVYETPAVTVYNPGEWFPLVMSLQGGDYIGPEKHRGSLVIYNQFDSPLEGYKRRLTGGCEYPLYRFFGQFIRGSRITYTRTPEGSIVANSIMSTT